MNRSPVPARLVALISGSGSNLQAILDAISSGRLQAEVVAVISNREHAHGLERARNAGIPAIWLPHDGFASRADFEQRLGQEIDRFQPTLIVLAGFMRILSSTFVERYPDRILNVHPSLLPDYKGTDTHQRVLDAGETQHGASVHLVTAALDDGPLLLQAKVPVYKDDTEASLAARVLVQEHRIYPEAIQRIIDGRILISAGQPEFTTADLESA